jgi:hypothetical protein
VVETFQVISVIHAVVSVLWVLLDFIVAGIVVYRFRATLTSWLLAGGFVFFALVRVLSSIVSWLVLPRTGDYVTWNMVSYAVFTALYVVTTLVVATGVGFIPRSLRRLGAGDQGQCDPPKTR